MKTITEMKARREDCRLRAVAIIEKAEKEVLRAIEMGVNYLDTAYIYPGSEECLGKILKNNNVREKVSIATKLPQYLMRNPEAIEKTFQEELKRVQTDYVDYYLMHLITDVAAWEKLQNGEDIIPPKYDFGTEFEDELEYIRENPI